MQSLELVEIRLYIFWYRQNVGSVSSYLYNAACLFYQERIPPLVDDFLYICDDAYTRSEFVLMEKDILRVVDFNLGMPISYRFLRRFAKVSTFPTRLAPTEPLSSSSTWTPFALQQAFQTSMTRWSYNEMYHGKAVPKSVLIIDFVWSGSLMKRLHMQRIMACKL